MSQDSREGFGRLQLMGIVAVLSFGLSALLAVTGMTPVVPIPFILGFFMVIPLIALLGERFPLVESSKDKSEQAAVAPPERDPVETLRDRFARGEISQEEFERRLDYLVVTEGLAFDISDELDAVHSRPDGRLDQSHAPERGKRGHGSRERDLEVE